MSKVNNKIILVTFVAVIASAFAGTMIGRNWTKFPNTPTVESTHTTPVVTSLTLAR